MSDPFDYAAAAYSIPSYKANAHPRSWEILARPGSWWTGAERSDALQAELGLERAAQPRLGS